jgi:hypothetical protein
MRFTIETVSGDPGTLIVVIGARSHLVVVSHEATTFSVALTTRRTGRRGLSKAPVGLYYTYVLCSCTGYMIESFTCMPLKKLVVTCVPLKSLFTPLYHRLELLCPLRHSVDFLT